jgi:tRNA 2-selenouridine synthase
MPLPIEAFLDKAENMPVIDVRSPKEFAQGHIPGAVSIPLFDNDERAKVGTKYKHAGKDAAVLLGLELVGPKMADFVKSSKKIAKTGEVLVHCWRGGMRSGSFAWLLNTAGLKADTLQKGYKTYRQTVLDFFEKPLQIMVLGGKTGSGKTEILYELEKLGEQIVDLEAVAHHKGSSYGSINEMPQPTSEQFENNLFAKMRKLDFSRRIWVEDESKSIGTVFVPNGLWHQMRETKVIFADIPKTERIKRLVKMYTDCDIQLLEEATQRIEKRLGGMDFKNAMKALAQKDFETVADIALHYYDKAYLYGLSKRNEKNIFTINFSEDNPAENARQILDFCTKTGL